MNDQTSKRFAVLTDAAGLETSLPEVGNARHAIVILQLRIYDEIGSTFLLFIE
jgi:hypothetical protein